MMENGTLAAVDPGREKCGIAVLDVHGVVLFQKVIETLNLAREINDKHSRYAFAVLVLGNGTTSKEAKERIEEAVPGLRVVLVDEYRTGRHVRRVAGGGFCPPRCSCRPSLSMILLPSSLHGAFLKKRR